MNQHSDQQEKNVPSNQQELKSKIILAQEERGEQASQVIKPAQDLQNDCQWQALPHASDEDSADNSASQKNKLPKAKKSRWLFILFSSLLLLSAVELIYSVAELYKTHDWLAALWLVLLIGFLVVTSVQIIKEWQGLKRLKKQQTYHQQAEQFFYSPAIGQAKGFCLKMASRLPTAMENEVISWQQGLASHYNDREILSLFEQQVVAKADARALEIISAHAGAAGVMIAVSPFALLDMAIVLWRNTRMLHQISDVYGVQLGYWGRIALIRSVFKTMLYAGASEILADAGNYALGAGLTGKLSTRLAQGMGAGVLTARIGVKAIQECRPMPWLSCKNPGISAISQQLLHDLKKLLP